METERRNPQKICLTVSDISMRYGSGSGQISVWSGVSFELREGECLGIRGNNGAGKSTLLRILATLERPTEGSIRYQGEDIFRGAGRRNFRSVLGYVPQEIGLYPELSGYDNLRFFGRANHVGGRLLEQRIKTVCRDIRLNEDILKKKTGLCSGGMKRRLNLAAALLHEPKLLLLDEPAVGIDEDSRQVILQELSARRSRGVAMIYVGHEEQELAAVSTVRARLEDGKWIKDGTAVEC